MITNRRREHAVVLPAGTPGVLLGRDLAGVGGREGVLNGGRCARLNLTNGIAEDLNVYFLARVTRDAAPVVFGGAVLPASESLSVTFDREDCAAWELAVMTESANGGGVTVDWTVLR